MAIGDISKQIGIMGGFSVEYEERGRFLHLSVRFWHNDQLCKINLARCGRTVDFPVGYLGLLSRVLSAVSTSPGLVSCSGCPDDVYQTFDDSGYFKRGIQRPFRFSDLDMARLFHKHCFSVFGRLDFYSVVEHLVISLGGILDKRWSINVPELVKVISFVLICVVRDVFKRG